MKSLLLLISLLLAVPSVQAAERHPRVSEVEDKIKKDANNYLEARFPGLPFSVNVSIDPLRRVSAEAYSIKGEILPFYALDEENIKDEWDDPTASLYTLSTRVKKIFVTVQVPESLSQEEIDEAKISLTQILRLIPARDQIEVNRRKWSLFPHLKFYSFIAGSGLIVFLLGLFLIIYLSTRKVSASLENVQAYLKNSGSTSAPALAKSTSSANFKDSHANSGGSGGQDLRFNDPIKLREVILNRVESLIKNKDLLRLENMKLLDDLGGRDPQALGALLTLFPLSLQKELFSYSRGTHWLEAFTNPGDLNMKTLELVEDLSLVKSIIYRENWEKLLIQVWRMEEEATQFLKALKLDQAMALLGAMPKYVSLPLARAAFPGNWAILLDPGAQFQEIPEDVCKDIYDRTLNTKPLESFEVLEVYKKYIELLRFVETADIRTEKEIYEASSRDSMLYRLRPPFYLLFEQSPEVISAIFKQFDIGDWALALFNVPRDVRYSIETLLNSKERFYYVELLQDFDRNPPSTDRVAAIRMQIASTLQALREAHPDDFSTAATTTDEENRVETTAA